MDFPIETAWDDEAPAAAASGDRLNVPEGEHEFRIRQVIEDADRLEIRLEHDERGFGWVFFTVDKRRPKQFQKKLIAQLAASLALSPEAWSSTDAGDLAGRRVKATVQHRTADSGRVFVNVWGFAPVAELEEPAAKPAGKAPAKRTPSQKVAASMDDPDAIPF
jgi:hypothetical protein